MLLFELYFLFIYFFLQIDSEADRLAMYGLTGDASDDEDEENNEMNDEDEDLNIDSDENDDSDENEAYDGKHLGMLYIYSSYDFAVIQWITSCYKNRMTTRYITLWWEQLRHDDVHVNHAFSVEQLSTVKSIKSNLKGSYDKQNLTLVVISYKIYETRQRLVS